MKPFNPDQNHPFKLARRNIILIVILFSLRIIFAVRFGFHKIGYAVVILFGLVAFTTFISFLVWSISKGNNKRAQITFTVVLILSLFSQYSKKDMKLRKQENQIVRESTRLKEELKKYRKGERKEFPNMNPVIDKMAKYLESLNAKENTVDSFKKLFNTFQNSAYILNPLEKCKIFQTRKLKKNKITACKSIIVKVQKNLENIKIQVSQNLSEFYQQKNKEFNSKISSFIESFYQGLKRKFTAKYNLASKYLQALLEKVRFLYKNRKEIEYDKKEDLVLLNGDKMVSKYKSILTKINELENKLNTFK